MVDWSNKRVLVTGASGFLGRHVVAQVQAKNPKALVQVGQKPFDLTKESEVEKLFAQAKPDIVFHLAGYVGGILANRERSAEFFYRNLMMGTLVLHHAYANGVEALVAAGAGCGYPEFAPLPLTETSLWDGRPQKESAPYSLAKRMLVVQSQAYQQQYGFRSIVCIPGNIYGEYDNFSLHDSHVVPALVRKFVQATQNKLTSVEVWGTGEPTRDYVYAGDVALGMVRAAEVYGQSEVVNLSSGQETSVRQICDHLRELTRFDGEIKFDTSKPEGQKRRWFDVSKARRDLDFTTPTSLQEGLRKTVTWFLDNMKSPDIRL
jgi:GDP-L-fucose synthase